MCFKFGAERIVALKRVELPLKLLEFLMKKRLKKKKKACVFGKGLDI